MGTRSHMGSSARVTSMAGTSGLDALHRTAAHVTSSTTPPAASSRRTRARQSSTDGPPAAWVRKDNACDAAVPPANGAAGTCSDTLASGSSCQPTCDAGYTVSGTSSCLNRVLTSATCSPTPCDASSPPETAPSATAPALWRVARRAPLAATPATPYPAPGHAAEAPSLTQLCATPTRVTQPPPSPTAP